MYMYTYVHTLCYVTLGTDSAQLESADTEIFDDIHLPQVPPSKTTPDGVTWGKKHVTWTCDSLCLERQCDSK